jgi:hypothetical protein
MSQQPTVTDLIILVADRNMEAAVVGLLTRRKSLRISEQFSFDINRHPEKDAGCRIRAHEFLVPFQRQYRFGIVLFDREGCGSSASAQEIATEVQGQLDSKGWKDRSAVIVFDPELEVWVWSDSPHVATELGWRQARDLRGWLIEQGELEVNSPKPNRPKEAMEKVLRTTKKPRSSAIYEALSKKVGLSTCADLAFVQFRETLQRWFPTP